jgi:MFS transporter, DHA2 family, multidrug resistance protein
VAVDALQMLLDRGELKDWFNSTEIWVEAMVSSICFYLFIIHTVTAGDRSFNNRDLLKSPNFTARTVPMFLPGTFSAAPWRCCRRCFSP